MKYVRRMLLHKVTLFGSYSPARTWPSELEKHTQGKSMPDPPAFAWVNMGFLPNDN